MSPAFFLRPALRCCLALSFACVLAANPPARAVILLGTGDPAVNTTEPTGALANSGWQYEGLFGGFLGTPIAPRFFITAAHFGFAGSTIFFQGNSYEVALDPTVSPPQPLAYRDPGSDLIIYQITGTFPSYAPLWTAPGAEVGKPLVVIGRGTQRGGEVRVGADDHFAGWGWGNSDGAQRWGQNTVTDLVDGGPAFGKFLHAAFDAAGGANEATLSVGDSGGAVFIRDVDGRWKLAGINYAVDGPYYRKNTPDTPEDPNPAFYAALYNSGGLYENDSGRYVAATNPGGFYATQIANRLAFINVVLRNSPLAKVGNDVLFGFGSESGKRYRVERCDDLAAGRWTTLADNVPGNGGTVLITDAGAASLVRRFYRVATLP